MRSKLFAMTAFTPSNIVPLAAQSRDEPVPYSLPASTIEWRALPLVLERGIVDRHLFAARLMTGPAALGARRQQIAQADVGKRAAHHDFVIAAAGTVGIEVDRLHTLSNR